MKIIKYSTPLLAIFSSFAFAELDQKLIDEVDSKFPYLSRIVTIEGSIRTTICGASIIDHDTILTTASCIDKANGKELGIVFGAHQKEGWEDENLRVADNIVVHNDYDSVTKRNDIAIIKIIGGIEDKSRYAGIPSNEALVDLLSESTFYSAGFGNHNVGIPSNQSKIIETNIESSNYCESNYVMDDSFDVAGDYPFDSNIQMCSTLKGMQLYCEQDDGNPVAIYSHSEQKYVQVGLLSHSNKDCNMMFTPDLITKIGPYKDWIINNSDIIPGGDTDNSDSSNEESAGGGSMGFFSVLLIVLSVFRRKK